MQEYYSANISINDICNLIYLSPCHFKRVFKDCTGQTPYQYLMKIRLEKAKEILKEKESSMEEVARLCGFVNTGHFATVFKRNIGMSPSEYRKQAL
ncbi:MAG: helix-turn-helix transcriptional regulator [Epulopiscium sp.]|nr:helix-turn-helix transcriptional regulator [Candidatus Epulonipiscium sp.]